VEQEGLLEGLLSSPGALASLPGQEVTHEGKDETENASCLVSCSAGPSMVFEDSQYTAFPQGDIPCCFLATSLASAIDMLGHTSHRGSLAEEMGREEA